MGLFWSMARLPGEALPIPADSMMRAFRARLEATSAEGVEAATELDGGSRRGGYATTHFEPQVSSGRCFCRRGRGDSRR